MKQSGSQINPIPPGNTDQTINRFSGEYEFLSNFSACTIRMHNILFYSAEQAYHWHKLARIEDRRTLTTLVDPMKAKWFSRKCEIIPDWDEMRTGIMLSVLIDKFTQNGWLLTKLYQTAPKLLIEGNHWNDTFWGAVWKGRWEGENHLGRILMIVRDNL